MAEPGDGPALAEESVEDAGAVDDLPPHHLEDLVAPRQGVVGEVDDAHPAPAKLAPDLEIRALGEAGGEGEGGRDRPRPGPVVVLRVANRGEEGVGRRLGDTFPALVAVGDVPLDRLRPVALDLAEGEQDQLIEGRVEGMREVHRTASRAGGFLRSALGNGGSGSPPFPKNQFIRGVRRPPASTASGFDAWRNPDWWVDRQAKQQVHLTFKYTKLISPERVQMPSITFPVTNDLESQLVVVATPQGKEVRIVILFPDVIYPVVFNIIQAGVRSPLMGLMTGVMVTIRKYMVFRVTIRLGFR